MKALLLTISLAFFVASIGLGQSQVRPMFYSVAHTNWPPLPSLPSVHGTNTFFPLWSKDGTNWWFDDRGFQYPTDAPASVWPPPKTLVIHPRPWGDFDTNALLAHPQGIQLLKGVPDDFHWKAEHKT